MARLSGLHTIPLLNSEAATKTFVETTVAANGGGSGGPIGSILAWTSNSIPFGYLLCDGSEISRTTYADLFAAIGTTFGVGDGSTTFNLPDLRGRFPLGKSTSGTGSTLGQSGGSLDHTHSIPAHFHSMGSGADLNITASGSGTTGIESAGHTHSGTTGIESQGHTHLVSGTTGSSGAHTHDIFINDSGPFATERPLRGGADANVKVASTQSAGSHTHSFSTTSGGVSANHTHSFTTGGVSANHTHSTPAHTHGAGNFAGRIGLVTGGVDGNAAMTSGTENPPFLAINYIIKWTQNIQDASGGITFGSASYNIRSNSDDGADDRYLVITAGGSAATDGTRGGFLQLNGNEVSGFGGNAHLFSGDAPNAFLNLNASSTTGQIRLGIGGNINWRILSNGSFAGNSSGENYITTNTTDGSDTAAICIVAGGIGNATRGAQIIVGGNEYSLPGRLYLDSGGTGDVYIRSFNSSSPSVNIMGDLLPSASSTYSIGNSSLSWNNITVSTTTLLAGGNVRNVGNTGGLAFLSQQSFNANGSTGACIGLGSQTTGGHYGLGNGELLLASGSSGQISFYAAGSQRASLTSSQLLINGYTGITPLQITNSTVSTGAAADTMIAITNNNQTVQFFAWQNIGLRIGNRGVTGGGTRGIYFTINNDNVAWVMDGSGHFTPAAHNTYNLGSGSAYIATTFTINVNSSYLLTGRANASSAATSGLHMGVDGTIYSYLRLNDNDIDTDLWAFRHIHLVNANGNGGSTFVHGDSDTGLVINAYSLRPRLLFTTNSAVVGAIFVDNGGFATGANNAVAIRAGGSGNGVHLPAGGTSWSSHSDARDKKNIVAISKDNALDVISNLQPRRFDYNDDESDTSKRIGFVAQEVLSVLPDIVDGTVDTKLSLRMLEMIPYLVGAIQKLKEENDELKARVEALENSQDN